MLAADAGPHASIWPQEARWALLLPSWLAKRTSLHDTGRSPCHEPLGYGWNEYDAVPPACIRPQEARWALLLPDGLVKRPSLHSSGISGSICAEDFVRLSVAEPMLSRLPASGCRKPAGPCCCLAGLPKASAWTLRVRPQKYQTQNLCTCKPLLLEVQSTAERMLSCLRVSGCRKPAGPHCC